MTWRDHTWEFTVSALSWLVAIGALGCLVMFLVFERFKNRRKGPR